MKASANSGGPTGKRAPRRLPCWSTLRPSNHGSLTKLFPSHSRVSWPFLFAGLGLLGLKHGLWTVRAAVQAAGRELSRPTWS